jgi:hypothetical protein
MWSEEDPNDMTCVTVSFDRAIAQSIVTGFPPHWPVFDPRSRHVGFLVNKVALGQILSEYLGFPCQFSFHPLLPTHHHLSFRADNRRNNG